MIISHIIGGLGNQLFQFAAGRCLADVNHTDLKLDLSAYKDYSLRNFDLQQLDIKLAFPTANEISSLLPSHNFEKAFQYLKSPRKRTYYREKYFHFDPDFFRLGNNVYLKGYFQSEKYFLPSRHLIRKELRFQSSLTMNLATMAARLKNTNSCSIHIRRGDISNNNESLDYHGNLSMDYYHAALQKLNAVHSNIEYFLFSDDIEWAKQNFIIPSDNYLSGKVSTNHIEDLYLMSQCRHHIIANSSFSWWGAWLNDNPDKTVIAPLNWFNNGPTDTQDLIPDGWIRV